MSEIKKQRLDIAASIFSLPCTEKELLKRDLFKNKSVEGIERMIMHLEKDAIYFKGDVLYIKKEWAKKNLQEYEFDFRSEKQKYIDSLTTFARQVYGLQRHSSTGREGLLKNETTLNHETPPIANRC